MTDRIKYITNKELLAEIHKSKNTFSSYERPEYNKYDIIVQNLRDINPATIQAAKEKKALLLSNKTEKVDPNSIDTADLVFRVMEVTHIPLDVTGKRKPKNVGEDALTKTTFPPFSHYVFKEGKLAEVGRSHWVGSISNGYYSPDHGKINNRLAAMFMLLVERYSRRSNWRSYCVDQTTEALTQRGWLGINEINDKDIILSYHEGQLKWSKIRSIYRGDYEGKMFKLTLRGMDALVTPHHKFVTDKGLKEVEYLNASDSLILMGDPVEPTMRGNAKSNMFIPTMPFLLGLSQEHRLDLMEKMIDQRSGSFEFDNKVIADSFLAMATMAGFRMSYKETPNEKYTVDVLLEANTTTVDLVDFHGGKGKKAHPNQPTEDYNGKVWCPETEFGSFIVRRNGTIYLTGNSYNDEMRSHALLQLAQIALQFDESKSENPFAFYTTIITNCFRRVLLLEKRSQHIRDDLLIMHGAAPSYNKQIDHEMAQYKEDNQQPISVVEAAKRKNVTAKTETLPDVEWILESDTPPTK